MFATADSIAIPQLSIRIQFQPYRSLNMSRTHGDFKLITEPADSINFDGPFDQEIKVELKVDVLLVYDSTDFGKTNQQFTVYWLPANYNNLSLVAAD